MAVALVQLVEEEIPYAVAATTTAQDAEAVLATDDVEEQEEDAAADGLAPASLAVMTWTEYVVAYKRLCEDEINSILSRQPKPFKSSIVYNDMVAEGCTKEDMERAAADHEYTQKVLSELRERVRREYAEKGFVAVDDDAIAERLELEQHLKETWNTMFDEFGLDNSMFEE